MRIGIISQLLSDPRATLIVLLLALPGRMLAICGHEAAHGWVAERCGDPTARRSGRITLNPLKHLDPVGFVCFLLLGIGWARPVPVNPNNFRHGRKDDLKVSLAGICANLLMFLTGTILLYVIACAVLANLPVYGSGAVSELYRYSVSGTPALVTSDGWYQVRDLMNNAAYISDVLIAPACGRVAGWLYDMLGYFVSCNLMLAVFNLIPVPPLDGYHVLNDLVLKRNLFASRDAARTCMVILYVAIFMGWVSKVLSYVYSGVFSVFGLGVTSLLTGMGLF